jgi:TatD DNase family protein
MRQFLFNGIHPWYIVEGRMESDLQIIESKLQQSNCLAIIGECGLDKRIEIPMDIQQAVFEKTVDFGTKICSRCYTLCGCFSKFIETKKRLHISVPMIIHGFSKNEQTLSNY